MKRKVLLTFPSNLTDSPITYNLVKNYDLKFNILRAAIKYNVEGSLLLELEGEEDNISSGIVYLESMGVKVDFVHTKIDWDEKNCVHCGACTAVCMSGALHMDSSSKVSFDEEKCLGCLLCIKACPLKAIEDSL